ncbi:restriction endonuclease subunit S [Streptococcus suis]
MTKIEEMLADLCPNGVEWKELGEVCELKNGYTPSKSNKEFWENGTIPWFRLEDIRKKGRILSNSLQHISKTAVKGGKIFPANSLIISTTATIGEVALITVPFLCNQQITAVIKKENYEKNLDIKYLFYYLQILSNDMKKGINEGSFPIISLSKMKGFKIPIPPLEIQQEIVALLDKFTEYVTELTAELTDRQKQYSFYRDKLLSFEDEVYQVEWKTLGEVATFNYGYTDKASDEGEIRFIRITDIDENGYLKEVDKKYISASSEAEKYLVKNGDILMARTGATFGKTLFIKSDEKLVYASFLIKITPNKELNPRYYWHFSKSDLYWKQANNLVSKAGQPQFNANSLKKVKIPIPPLHIQQRIVQVLDNFDTVCNDLNIGLPKEIEQRQKQYEYFRDKLLTFTAEGVYPGQWTVDSGQWAGTV